MDSALKFNFVMFLLFFFYFIWHKEILVTVDTSRKSQIKPSTRTRLSLDARINTFLKENLKAKLAGVHYAPVCHMRSDGDSCTQIKRPDAFTVFY